MSQWESLVDRVPPAVENSDMKIFGHVENGVVVLDDSASLPDGTRVTVTVRSKPMIHAAENRRRIEFPLVESGRPGSVALTNERIAEILGDEDVEDMKRASDAPS